MFNYGCSTQPSTGLSIFLYHVNAVLLVCFWFLFRLFLFFVCLFYLSPTLGFGIFRNWRLNVDDFSIHWFSLPLLIGSVLKVSTFHKIHHGNSRGLKKKNSVTWQQAKEIIKSCPVCSFYNQIPLPAKTNPKGMQK